MGEGNRVALIVACDRYADPELKQLQAPSQDAESFATILEDPKIGGFKVSRLINEPYNTIKEKIDEFLQSCSRDDTILLYFSCHGIKDKNGQLYFATITTDRKRLRSTGIESNFVNAMLDECRAQKKVVLLDCCYSGAFEKGRVVRADEQVNATQFFGEGSVIITASDAMQYAFEGDDKIDLGRGGSYFTNALIEGLKSGAADLDHDGKITYQELFGYMDKRIREYTRDQTPTLNARGVKGDFEIFKSVMETPRGSYELIMRGNEFLEKRMFQDAILCYDQALAIEPRSEYAWNNKGLTLDDLGRHEEAIACYDKVIEINPEFEIAWYNKGNTLGDLGRHEEAIACYDKVIEINPEYGSAWFNKGWILVTKLGRHEEAIACYDKAIEINPEQAKTWFNKGRVLEKLGNKKYAKECYKKAKELEYKG